MAKAASMAGPIGVRPATSRDRPGLLNIFMKVIAKGDTYPYPPETTRADAERIWFAPHHRVYVAVDETGVVYGHFYLRPNQPGLGDHVANAGFMVDPDHQGKGIGRILGEAAIEEARRLGFTAMQFNLVVTTNTPSVRLWGSLGFRIIGTIPKAFRHIHNGPVDAHVMFREL